VIRSTTDEPSGATESMEPPTVRFWVTSRIEKVALLNVPAGAVSVTVPGATSWPDELVVNPTVYRTPVAPAAVVDGATDVCDTPCAATNV
jgi:hypothetical protein